MVNFAAIANKKVADIERPPNVPIGTYQALVSKIPVMGVVGGGKWETLDFMMKFMSATDDVDPDALKAYGDITKRTMRHRFMFSTEDAEAFAASEYRVKTFCFKHLLLEATPNMTFPEMLDATVSHQCLVSVRWRPDPNDAEIIYDEIGKTAPIS